MNEELMTTLEVSSYTNWPHSKVLTLVKNNMNEIGVVAFETRQSDVDGKSIDIALLNNPKTNLILKLISKDMRAAFNKIHAEVINELLGKGRFPDKKMMKEAADTALVRCHLFLDGETRTVNPKGDS